jgi:hypothetical protein
MAFRIRHAASFIASSATLGTIAAVVAFSPLAEAQNGKTEGALQSTPAAKSADAGKKFEDFDPKNFINPTNIDHKWMPLTPGTRFVYDGKTVEDDGSTLPHRVVINVTDFTKTIAGIRSVVAWDLDYSDGELVEAELAFYAQDKDGSVWYLGEYPEEYEAGKFVAAPAWIHGFEEARAGIMMRANPQPGTPSYSEGWGPAVGWTDRGKVDRIGQTTTVPAGRYTDVIVIAETSESEANAEQLKYYAPGVGNVKVGWRGAGEKTKETLDLTKIERLDAKAMAEVRAGALKMEKSAYTRSKNVYGRTTPLEQGPGAKTRAPK